ncbi:MAG: hypothetical protein HLUCCO17_08560 [Saliniramus fredricksonii]|uniref:Uncharacterized protein n=1 Tax=Saliniramus fredricksonii TaxID=1653334 RepID=A0A0P8BMU8_9HYPH|nr:hypothetical protein [Saliniramus fredricksonii]KPQ10952.1 MAG: hypothetical protein HLUCCO17_08560 [Saliniramus fredricksonii]SCC81905.1 hypothetical protein GA0071312_2876 [Saliniramus fredricksonii]
MTDERNDTIILTSALLAGLDHARQSEPEQPSRQDLATRIIAEWLLARGHLRGQGFDEGKRPDDLNTGNDD